jgi:methionine-R-sulfoxide reductase
MADKKDMPPLSEAERYIVLHKGTEPPFSGKYCSFKRKGTYVCRACGTPLYRSDDKFDSGCGWPSFDAEIPGRVTRLPDPDGVRIEIECANCSAHLGHVFEGERMTEKNTRH